MTTMTPVARIQRADPARSRWPAALGDAAAAYGCECALPFLIGIEAGGPERVALQPAPRQRAAAMSALGVATLLGLSACAPEGAGRQASADKVASALAKAERQIEHAKAKLFRLNRAGDAPDDAADHDQTAP